MADIVAAAGAHPFQVEDLEQIAVAAYRCSLMVEVEMADPFQVVEAPSLAEESATYSFLSQTNRSIKRFLNILELAPFCDFILIQRSHSVVAVIAYGREIIAKAFSILKTASHPRIPRIIPSHLITPP